MILNVSETFINMNNVDMFTIETQCDDWKRSPQTPAVALYFTNGTKKYIMPNHSIKDPSINDKVDLAFSIQNSIVNGYERNISICKIDGWIKE